MFLTFKRYSIAVELRKTFTHKNFVLITVVWGGIFFPDALYIYQCCYSRVANMTYKRFQYIKKDLRRGFFSILEPELSEIISWIKILDRRVVPVWYYTLRFNVSQTLNVAVSRCAMIPKWLCSMLSHEEPTIGRAESFFFFLLLASNKNISSLLM